MMQNEAGYVPLQSLWVELMLALRRGIAGMPGEGGGGEGEGGGGEGGGPKQVEIGPEKSVRVVPPMEQT